MNNDPHINKLLNVPIEWIKRKTEPEWYAFVDGEECTLTMNNFPEEPLYTLGWMGVSLDLDDAPSAWSIPRE